MFDILLLAVVVHAAVDQLVGAAAGLEPVATRRAAFPYAHRCFVSHAPALSTLARRPRRWTLLNELLHQRQALICKLVRYVRRAAISINEAIALTVTI